MTSSDRSTVVCYDTTMHELAVTEHLLQVVLAAAERADARAITSIDLVIGDLSSVVDDSERPLLDNGEWPWVTPRSPGERQDLYFFGYGVDHKSVLGDFVKIAGRIPIPPRFAFGTWWSRYWSYTDTDMQYLVN